MELDSRIKEGKRPLTCLDVEQARKFVGKQCLFSDSYVNYKNIKEYAKHPQYTGTLVAIRDKFQCRESEECPYRNGNDGYFYELVLPLEWVEEEEPKKTYRPYKNAQEMFEDIGVYIGDTIHFRSKAEETENHALITSYTTLKNGTEKICLGGAFYYTMQALFDLFELRSRGEWQPFGVEE